LQRLENAPVSSSDNRPLDDIVMENVVVFVDPFEEFQKQKREKDAVEEEKAEIKRQGGTEDDKTTWTGKRIRGDGTVVQSEQSGGVGKYLKAATDVGSGRGAAQEDDLEPEPPKKKVKVGGFGNFDGW